MLLVLVVPDKMDVTLPIEPVELAVITTGIVAVPVKEELADTRAGQLSIVDFSVVTPTFLIPLQKRNPRINTYVDRIRFVSNSEKLT